MPTPSKGPRQAAKKAEGSAGGFNIDMESLTLDEMEAMETALGLPLDAFEGARSKIPLVKAFAWVRMRKTRPDLTIEQVGAMPFSELDLGGAPSGE